MSKLKMICISGKARAGKDTLATFLKETLEENGSKTLIVHYGDLLKYLCSNYLNWDGNKDEQGRSLLQTFGTDIVRKDNEYFWIKFIDTALNYTTRLVDYEYIIIADCRFPNEIDYWIDNNYPVFWIRVERCQLNDLTEDQRKHSSETALDDYTRMKPFVVRNDTTEQQLKNQCKHIINYAEGVFNKYE